MKTHTKTTPHYNAPARSSFEGHFPAVGFHYEVSIGGSSGFEAAFQEVSGIEVASEVETIHEAGLNQYSHRVPKKTQYNNLVLKRGLWLKDSAMHQWVKETLQGGLLYFVEPKNVTVSLMDEKNETIMSWNFVRAYPVKWSVSGFNSMQSAVLIENIELAYSHWKFQSL
jgi:phage tail-like protein